MILVVVLTALLGPMVVVAVVNAIAAPRLHRYAAREAGPRVSVLVPARNEEANLGRLLPALSASRYRELEILVLDDQSTDATARVVRDAEGSDPRIRLLSGEPPPPGWTGKNWACRQLADRAAGEILVFCDADVVPGPDAIGRTVAAVDGAGVDVLTGFPRHERGGWLEDAVIPLVAKVPIAAMLVLPLVPRTRMPALSVGNGQWLAWRRSAYDRLGGHDAVRGEILEDVLLARLAKAEGLRLVAVLAARDLSIRMYVTSREMWQGFSKNLYLLTGGRDWTLALGMALLVTVGWGPLLAPLAPGTGGWGWLPLGLLVTLRALSARLFGDGALRSVLLHPVAVPAVLALALTSRSRHRGGTVSWKQRTVRTGGNR